MATLETALQQAISTVPECVAAGYVDIASGMLLAIKTVDSHPREVMDLLAAATADMYQGPNVSMIEKLFRQARGLPPDQSVHYFQEILVNSENLIHVFMRGKLHPEYVLVFVCRRTANLGMALTKARLALPQVESTL
ncbi:hypothetical protein [Frateuria defendens]|uniref:hypothetical protein n=1 Tax=Frateuria defendens TaxID=2219559 RepID=UPI00066FBE80|nr:hypothetical protein [Frateuria defendens]